MLSRLSYKALIGFTFIIFFVGCIVFLHHGRNIKINIFSSTTITAKPTIYIITPTYERFVQKPELTRLCHTFKLVKNLVWILIEDSPVKNIHVADFLRECGVDHVHLNAPTQVKVKNILKGDSEGAARGVPQRNKGLEWLRTQKWPPDHRGVVYFADDDNVYSLKLFEEMRSTRFASTWPVAFSGGLPIEGCVTTPSNSKSGAKKKLVGFRSIISIKRTFPIDMAGFAVNLKLVLTKDKAYFRQNAKIGMLESNILEDLGVPSPQELEIKANGCQEVLVWHTKTMTPNLSGWYTWLKKKKGNVENIRKWI